MDVGWVRILVWAASVAVFTYPQWRPAPRNRVADGQFSRRSDRADDSTELQPDVAQTPLPSPSPPLTPVVTVTKPVGEVDAAYTTQRPEEILEGLKGLTTLEKEQTVGLHTGLRMRVSGIVEDVASHWKEGIRVDIQSDGGANIWATFVDKWEQQARTLRPGTRISVDGRIEHVHRTAILLEDSRLHVDESDR